MKNFLLSIFMILLFSVFTGCVDKRIILVPQAQYYPTFDTSDFNQSKKYHINMWEESEEVNGTTVNYLVAEKQDLMGLIRDTKNLRSTYNVLLKKINEFNIIIKEQNKVQNSKKPTEVESINDSWFK